MANSRKKNSVTIAILKLKSLDELKSQLEHMRYVLEELPVSYRKRIDVFVSDNFSCDGSNEVFVSFYLQFKWLKYLVHSKRVLYDNNVLTPYSLSSSDYVWILAIDDLIGNAGILKDMLDLLDEYEPTGINCSTTSDNKEILPGIDANKVNIVTKMCEKIDVILKGGKVSANIIKRINIPQRSELKHFVGVSYMHLSLQGWLVTKFPKKTFLTIRQALILTKQKFGDRNNYHPRYACSVIEALAFNNLQTQCPDRFIGLNIPGIREYKFLINQVRGGTLASWHPDMMEEFIQNSFHEMLNNKLSFYRLFLALTAFSLLLFKPVFLRSALKGIISKTKINDCPIDRF
jgi:hypothetical protein